jgi:hypothetical protein
MGVDAQGCDTDKMDDGVAIPGRDGRLERDRPRSHTFMRRGGPDVHWENTKKREKSWPLHSLRFLELTISFSGTYTPSR